MSATRTWLMARLTGALVPQERAELELDAYRDEVRTEDAAEIAALRSQVAELLVERHSTNESLSEAAEALRVQRDRIAELEAEPLAWAAELDAKSLDNLLGALGAFTEHEPQDEAVDRIHELLRSVREAAAVEDDREPDVDGAGRTYAEYYPTARQHPSELALRTTRTTTGSAL
ncbi:hypothetical protein PUR59_04405 [Streptomyces sp. SP18ES09]|uniref:hypothetical protein n=1 Tax=Streptomyces sp. SP18ES09 TaxID=3002532 RepID=UPI002E76A9A4|nr:hypothetical protein [Streptomyces sp. SP18ES09]MEE1814263.1 hypothetical protein [Streptomyces sp. SP18ES09]